MTYIANIDPLVIDAENRVYSDYGFRVSVMDKAKSLIKFGLNPNVGTTRCTIWYTGEYEDNETYVADNTNSIDSISCGDNLNSENVRIEGHTMTGDAKTFVVQSVDLNGRTRVALTTALNRVTRCEHSDSSSTNLVGEVYVYEDTPLAAGKPSDETKIHLTIPDGENKSQKASTSLSDDDFWFVTGISAGYLTKSGTNTCEVRLEVREQGGVFKPVSKPLVLSTGTQGSEDFNPYVIIPSNADIRLTALASSNGQEITADIQGYLAAKI